jgi:(p)ppGpp synthase/HD superfamily hydrolase
MFQTLADAVALAEFAHRNQFDKAGFPYIEHPKRVLANVQAMGVAPFVQIAAILHDVIEDTPFTGSMLLDLGFSAPAVSLVETVSKKKGQTYEEFIEYIAVDRRAAMIKKADIADNTLPWRLEYLDPDVRDRLLAKYDRALEILG